MQLLLLPFFIFLSSASAQTGKLYTIYDGLSCTDVIQVLQDYKGFIWLATSNGLNRFDGSKFNIYYSNDRDSMALKCNNITSLFEDSNHNLWVGTSSGLWKYNREYNNFLKIPGVAVWGTYFNYHVQKIVETKSYGLLVATSGQGILKMNKYEELEFVDELNDHLLSAYISDVHEDKHQNLYINLENEGLFLKRPSSRTVECLLSYEQNSHHIMNGLIYENQGKGVIFNTNKGLFEIDVATFRIVPVLGLEETTMGIQSAKNGNTWLYTPRGEIRFFDKEGKLHTYENPVTKGELANNLVERLYEDDFQNLWFVIKDKGLYVHQPSNPIFKNYVSQNEKSLCIYADKEEVWIGTENNGIYIYGKGQEGHQPCLRHLLAGNSVYDLFRDKQGRLWAGTDIGLLWIDSDRYSIVKQFVYDPKNPNSISSNIIWNVTQDADGCLWVGTCGKGICRLDDLHTGSFSVFDDKYRKGQYQNRLNNNWILVTLVDSENHLWIGTTNGLGEYISERKTFLNHFCSDNDNSGKMIEGIIEVNKEIWIGTTTGIYIYDRNSRKWSQLTDHDFPSAIIKGLVKDQQNNVWASSLNCIYKINAVSHQFEKYTNNDGIYITNYSRKSMTSSDDGFVYFGGSNGVVSFLPQQVAKEKMKGKLVFTELLLFNRAVDAGDKLDGYTVIEKAIDEAKQITVAYNDCFLTIGFKVLNYSNLDEVSYYYQMKGYDKQWQTIPEKGEKKGTYTNLSPGDYWFIVKAQSGDSEQIKQIKVTVLPPWWMSKYMKVSYFLLFIFFIGFIFYYSYRKSLKTLEAQRLNHMAQLNEMKLQFFVNISHEIRTPLTLIMTPLEKLYHSSDTRNKAIYETMYRNAQRLLNLVNQLIDLRKIDKGYFTLQIERTEMIHYLERIVENFQYYADEKQIQISIESSYPRIYAFVDPDNFEKIISNLLFNALKFSPENSKITLGMSIMQDKPSKLRIEVTDQGIGIKNNMLKSIFDRFVQENNGKKNQGTGIGLHLCQQLTAMHHGTIWAESKEDKGATFCVEVPLGKRHFRDEEKVEVLKRPDFVAESFSKKTEQPSLEDYPIEISPNVSADRQFTILIADDESNIRNYLKDELNPRYKLLVCDNGEDALKMILTSLPDLIICDIMMPRIDGIALCKKVRSNYNIAHLPIILLTAKVNIESVQEGIAAGADEYITKPFNLDLLHMKIKKLIDMRMKLQYHYGKNVKFEVQEGNHTSSDDKLRKRIMEVMRKDLADPKLNVGFLSQQVGLSRVHLNRKLKEFYNMSPHDYIKVTRMKQAAILLKERKLNIAEIAYAVGFSNHAHFTVSFREFYGITPKEYLNESVHEIPSVE